MITKKFSLVILLAVALTGYVRAQALSESVKITADQVPASIKKSYEKEFGEVPDGGNWTVRITRSTERGRLVANPVSYSYTNRNKREKIEVRFSPEGEILNSKGIARRTGGQQNAEPGASQQPNSHSR